MSSDTGTLIWRSNRHRSRSGVSRGRRRRERRSCSGLSTGSRRWRRADSRSRRRSRSVLQFTPVRGDWLPSQSSMLVAPLSAIVKKQSERSVQAPSVVARRSKKFAERRVASRASPPGRRTGDMRRAGGFSRGRRRISIFRERSETGEHGGFTDVSLIRTDTHRSTYFFAWLLVR